MTSKAAKKAYQQRNKGPKLSRAEQRRLDAEELDRQKKEYEKERAASRAKAAREKKAAKEQAEKDARKKMGLPEPSRFVRASQPTISLFVRKGNKRSWQEMEALAEDSEGTVCDRDSDANSRAMQSAIDDDTEDEFGDFPPLTQSDLPRLFDEVVGSFNKPEEQEDDAQGQPGRKVSTSDDGRYPVDEELLADMVTAQLLSDAAEAAEKAKEMNSGIAVNVVPQPESLETVQDRSSIATRSISSIPKRPTVLRRALQERSVNTPTPDAPVAKASRSITFAASPPHLQNARTMRSVNPPSATQAFLENHLDDFFPSPSQEVRELLDNIDDLPSNTQIARELSPTKAVDDDPYVNLISTQDLVLSSQDILEIITPSRPPTRGLGHQARSPRRPVSRGKGRFFEEKEEDLLNAALHESIIVAGQNMPDRLVEMEKSPKRRDRTFQRVLSTVTDYGDEEFNEQELLTLC